MYCKSCGDLLLPVSDSNYAFYRATTFQCENSECSKYDKKVYLNHCLNKNCYEIIDSRDSEKCPNGFYICSHEKCGCCCSTEKFRQRLSNLERTGGYISDRLRNIVDNKLGHLEKEQYFCYKCGRSMKKVSNNVFECETCNLKYDHN